MTAESGAKYGGERRSHPCLGYGVVLRRGGKHGDSNAATDDCERITIYEE